MKLKEQMAISEHVAKKIQAEAKMFKFGAITDNTLGESLRVTVIAAGFNASNTLTEQLKGVVDNTEPVLKATVDAETPVVSEQPADSAVPELNDVQSEFEAMPTVVDEPVDQPMGVTVPAKEEELTPTGYANGAATIRPDSYISPRKADTYQMDTLELLDVADRPSDADLVKKLVESFVKDGYQAAELDKPAFERNKTDLYPISMLAEHEFVRSKLNE